MNTSEQYRTVQSYVCSLFDMLPRIEIGEDTLREKRETLIEKLLEQNTHYGRKIIQLSEHFTSKYRNDMFIERVGIEPLVVELYRVVQGQESLFPLEQMLQTVLSTLKREALRSCENENEKSQKSRGMSKTKSQVRSNRSQASKGEVRCLLQVKGWLEEEEGEFREIFAQLGQQMREMGLVVNPEKMKYVRRVSQNEQDTLQQFIRAASQNHVGNLRELKELLRYMEEGCVRRCRKEGEAEGQLGVYCRQIEKREQVYSYAVSKLLEHLAALKRTVQEGQGVKMVANLQEIAGKFYELYPSSAVMADLEVHRKDRAGCNTQATQTKPEKKASLETYRTQVKVEEYLARFLKSIQFRKVQNKEIQKLFQSLRNCFPLKGQKDPSFEEQLHRIMELHERNQKELGDAYSKKLRKMEKREGELEGIIAEKEIELKKEKEERQREKKKLLRKLQIERAETSKLVERKDKLESQIGQSLQQIEELKEAVKSQGSYFQESTRQYHLDRSHLENMSREKEARGLALSEELKVQRSRMGQERAIYRDKITLMETREEQYLKRANQMEREGSLLIKENERLTLRVGEMERVYEEKIREVEDMIQNIRELQTNLRVSRVEIQELKEAGVIEAQKLKGMEREVERKAAELEKVKAEKAALKEQAERYKEVGLLNGADIGELKEQMDNVNKAYLETEEQLESIKAEMEIVQAENDRLNKQKAKITRVITELEEQMQTLRLNREHGEVSQRDLRQSLQVRNREYSGLLREGQQRQRELVRMRKQIGEMREREMRMESESRQLRQQLQKKRESESVQGGKRRMQMEGLRVQVRRKSEQLQKQKESYEEKLSVLGQRVKEMQQFISQKQLLARITNSHQSQ